MDYTTTDIDNAAARFRGAEQSLLRQDGTRLYSDEEHGERVQALLATFDGVAEAAYEHAGQRIAEAEKVLHALDHDDPASRLAPDDLARANAKALFIREDCESLDLAALTERLRVALASGDKPTQYLYARYGDRRAKAVVGAMRQGTQGVDTAALRDLNAVLTQFNPVLADPHAASKRTKAEATIKEARALRLHAGKVRGEIDGSTAANVERMRREFAGRF